MSLRRVLPLLFAVATAACTYEVKELPLEQADRHATAVEGTTDADAGADADASADR